MFKKVMGKRVMCAYPEVKDKTAGGIIIPENAIDIKGKQRMKVTLSGIDGINPGDEVAFCKYHGTTVEFEGKEYLFLKEDEILGVL